MKTTSQFSKHLIRLCWFTFCFSGTLQASPSIQFGFDGYKYYSTSIPLYFNSTKNSCIYDRNPPMVSASEIKIGEVNCTEIANLPWSSLIDISDDCTPKYLLEVSSKDSVLQNCGGRGIEIIRKFIVSDRAGNKAYYNVELFTNRVELSEVDFPQRVDWYCPSTKGLQPDETGSPSYKGLPIDHYCGITVAFKDFATKLCGTTTYIRRHWSITDCCTLFTNNFDQDIYVHDTTKPIITCPLPLRYSTNVKECYSHQIIPGLQATDICNPGNLGIKVILDDNETYKVGDKVILKLGNHIYKYFVTDACGNTSTCTVAVEVYDGQAPLLSCNTVDVCLLTPTATVCAKEFVNEYWDDCNGLSNVTLKVRKLEDFCGHPEETEFGDCITICCEGNQKVILVEVIATDKVGNSATCITEVNVTSKLPLEIKCQDTIRLSCGDPIPNTPADVNFCGEYTVTTKTIFDNRNGAGMGTIIRRYIVMTSDGRKDSCQTVIVIGLGPNAFGADDVTCPNATVDINGCIIPNLNSIPGIGLKDTARPCTQLNLTLKLDTFTNLGTPCIRVRRTWTIKDALQPALNITCVQNININDTEKPVISGVKDTTVNAGVNCTALIDLPAAIATDCDPNVIITNSLNNQGANIAPTSFPIGMTTIRYRATDKCGNRDSVTLKVTVLSNSGFSIICQPDTIVNCGVNFVPRAAVINASCTQIASNVLRSDTVRNKCSITKINFKRIVTDTAGRKDSCTFMVTFRANDTLFCNQIVWAKDTTLNNCNKSLHPDSINLRPTIVFNNGNCSKLAILFKDTLLATGCTLITRRIWTVSDTCPLNPLVCRDTQLITVIDNSAPIIKIPKDTMVFLRTGTDTLLSFLGNATATDCDPNVVIKNVIIGRTDTVGASLNRRYSLGTNRVLVLAADACGNTSKDTLIIQVKDTVNPDAICRKTNNYLSDLGSIIVKSKQFDGGSSDNSTPANQLRFSWTKKLADTVIEVNCNVIKIIRAGGDTILDSVRVFPFERNFNLWVTDISGNQDTCLGNRFLAFFDTLNVCGKAAIRTNAAIQGKVAMMNGKSIPNVILSAIGDEQAQNKTDDKGAYLIKDIIPGMYKLIPYKNDDPALGVSTSDLIAIQKHILGLSVLSGADKMVAADINNDGDVSSVDLIELRKLILGIYDQFPQNTSWRFFDQSIMARTTDHLALKDFEKPFIEAKKESISVQNFVGIKIGDVNGSADPKLNSLESRSRLEQSIIVPNIKLQENSLVEIPFLISLDKMEGLQAAIKFKNAEIVGIKENGGLISQKNFNELGFKDGIARFSWIRPQDQIAKEGEKLLFTVYLRSFSDQLLSDITNFSKMSIKSEAYLTTGESVNLNFEFKTGSNILEVKDRFILSQNAPNPFNEFTNIKYSLPEKGKVRWFITDMTGRIVKNWESELGKGDHVQTINRQDLGSSGIYYYKLEYNGYSEIKKLILVD